MLKKLGVKIIEVKLNKKECGGYDYEQQWDEFIKTMQKDSV